MTSTGLLGRLVPPGLLLAIGLLLGPLAGPATADAVDDTFLASLKAKGINFESPERAITAAHEVCGELDTGRTPAQVASTVESNSNLDGYHAGFFVGAAIHAYCPQHTV